MSDEEVVYDSPKETGKFTVFIGKDNIQMRFYKKPNIPEILRRLGTLLIAVDFNRDVVISIAMEADHL